MPSKVKFEPWDPKQFTPQINQLWRETVQGHYVHDFRNEKPGRAIVMGKPLTATEDCVAEIYLHSPIEVKSGDIIIGGASASFMFNVTKNENPPDLYHAFMTLWPKDAVHGYGLDGASPVDPVEGRRPSTEVPVNELL
ncbi:MAG: hypothetical protein WBK55_10375 [Alphaproteobacteria bacterium]